MLKDLNKPPRIFFFCDIDDSLMVSRRKTRKGAIYSGAAINTRNEVCSFFSVKHLLLLDLIQSQANSLIPVTGRSSDSLARVNLNFDSYAVASHGAVILTPDGELSQDWLESIEADIRNWEPKILKFYTGLESVVYNLPIDTRISIVWDQGIASYVSVKGPRENLQMLLENIEHECQLLGFRVHFNDRNLAILPPYASKMRALSFVFDKMGVSENDLTIALGDSLSDLAFMEICDICMCPSDSQIQRRAHHMKFGY